MVESLRARAAVRRGPLISAPAAQLALLVIHLLLFVTATADAQATDEPEASSTGGGSLADRVMQVLAAGQQGVIGGGEPARAEAVNTRPLDNYRVRFEAQSDVAMECRHYARVCEIPPNETTVASAAHSTTTTATVMGGAAGVNDNSTAGSNVDAAPLSLPIVVGRCKLTLAS